MIEKIIVVAPTTAVPISTGLAVALKVLPAPSFSSRFSALAFSKSGLKPNCFSISASDARDGRSICGELVNGLRVVRHRAVAIDRDRHRPHAEEAEGHEAEREDRRVRRHQAGDKPNHEACSVVICAHISASMARGRVQNALKLPATKPERMFSDAPPSREAVTISATWLRGMVLVKTFGELGDQRARQRAARDDERQLPPQRAVAAASLISST